MVEKVDSGHIVKTMLNLLQVMEAMVAEENIKEEKAATVVLVWPYKRLVLAVTEEMVVMEVMAVPLAVLVATVEAEVLDCLMKKQAF